MPPKEGTQRITTDDDGQSDQTHQNNNSLKLDQIVSMLTEVCSRMSDLERSYERSYAELRSSFAEVRSAFKGDFNDVRERLNGANNNQNVDIGHLHLSSLTDNTVTEPDAIVNSNVTRILRNVENDAKDVQSREDAVENGNNVNATVSDGSINTRSVAQPNANNDTNMNKLSLIRHEVSNLGMARLRLAIFVCTDSVINEVVKLILPEPPDMVRNERVEMIPPKPPPPLGILLENNFIL